MKSITIADFLTEAEISQAVRMWTEDPRTFHKRVLTEILEPNMARINKALGQENDASYLAYMLEYVIGQGIKRDDT